MAFIGLMGVVVRMSHKLDDRAEMIDAKVNNVYKRIDTERDDTEKKYVQQKVCEILHRQLRNDLSEIKTDVKLLLLQSGASGDASKRGKA